MILQLRSIAGWIALASYFGMGAVIYFRVMPSADWHFPPDFHLLGYDAGSLAPFLEAISDRGRTAYLRVLALYDRVFIVALAVWMALVGWRGSGFRYFVLLLAALYASIDLAENAALIAVMAAETPDAGLISVAHHWTMAKFASLYLCILVLIVHVRRTV